MTLANVQATGSGRIRARLVIAGLDTVFVSSRNMQQTHADARVWVNGLIKDTLRWSVQADIANASLSADGFTATIVDHGGLATAALAKRPQQKTTLEASITDAETSITVSDTSGFASAGVIHLATEAISYTNTTPTSFTGCTRGIWGTTAQYHYIGNGAGLVSPHVTDVPEGLEGRPVEVYLYGDGDSGTGDGTIAFRGVCNRGARFASGTWTVGVDPITRILDQNIGGDLNDPTPIRGITYTTAAPLLLVIASSTTGESAEVKLTGHYDDSRAFCAELTTRIATATSGFTWPAGSSISAEPLTGGDWCLRYETGPAGTPSAIELDSTRVRTRIPRGSSSAVDTQQNIFWTTGDGVTAPPYALGTVYQINFSSAIPRGTVGIPRDGSTYDAGSPTFAEMFRVYLGGDVVPSIDMAISVENGDEIVPATISAIDAGDRTIDLLCSYTELGPDTKIRFGRKLAEGNLEDLRAALVADSPQYANAGAMPLVTSSDIAASTEVTAAAAANPAIGEDRLFVAYEGTTLGEIMRPEAQAIGCYMRIASTGAIEFKQIRASVATDTVDHTIGEGDVLRGTWPEMERGAYGLISAVEMRTGWDPKEGEHTGPLYRFRDMGASSPNRVSQTIEIAQMSVSPTAALTDAGLSIEDVRRAVMPVLGLFGVEYDIIQINVGMRYFSAKVGDTVSLTHSKVPAIDGTRGVTNEIAMVSACGVDLSTGTVSLQLLRHGQRLRGYAPAFRVDNGGVALVSGTTYDLTCNIADYTDAASIGDWLEAGDLVRVHEQDTATPLSYNATVVSIQSATVVRVLFAAAFVYGTAEWSIGARESSHYATTDNLGRFMFSAGSTRRVAFDNGETVDAMVFAP